VKSAPSRFPAGIARQGHVSQVLNHWSLQAQIGSDTVCHVWHTVELQRGRIRQLPEYSARSCQTSVRHVADDYVGLSLARKPLRAH
jgi:hypothetical protein